MPIFPSRYRPWPVGIDLPHSPAYNSLTSREREREREWVVMGHAQHPRPQPQPSQSMRTDEHRHDIYNSSFLRHHDMTANSTEWDPNAVGHGLDDHYPDHANHADADAHAEGQGMWGGREGEGEGEKEGDEQGQGNDVSAWVRRWPYHADICQVIYTKE